MSDEPRLSWKGACNQCGLCCTVTVKHNDRPMRLVCEHLRPNLSGGRALPLGHPMATKCAVYEQRVSGMPITMLDATGTPRMVGECHQNDWIEDQRILVHVGRGCSLTLADKAEVPLGTFIPTGGTR